MIVSLLLYIIYYFVLFILTPLRLFPDVSLPAGVLSAITTAGTYLALVSQVIPLTDLLGAFAASIVIENYHFVYKVIKWIYNKIPGVN